MLSVSVLHFFYWYKALGFPVIGDMVCILVIRLTNDPRPKTNDPITHNRQSITINPQPKRNEKSKMPEV